MIKEKRRHNYLDSVGGLLLIYMIIGHCCQWAHLWTEFDRYTYWLGFFMPWFFFKGGMFYKSKTNRDQISTSFRRLIVPFVWFTIIGTCILWIKEAIFGTFTLTTIIKNCKCFIREGSFPGNLALWFLISLFCVRIAFNYLHNKFKDSAGFCNYLWGGGIYGAMFSFYTVAYAI